MKLPSGPSRTPLKRCADDDRARYLRRNDLLGLINKTQKRIQKITPRTRLRYYPSYGDLWIEWPVEVPPERTVYISRWRS